MLISPSGATADTIAPNNIVKVSLDGQWEGERKPSSEWRMHAAIYEAHEKTNAVVHTHSDYCVALACQLKLYPAFITSEVHLAATMSHVSRIPRLALSRWAMMQRRHSKTGAPACWANTA